MFKSFALWFELNNDLTNCLQIVKSLSKAVTYCVRSSMPCNRFRAAATGASKLKLYFVRRL